MNMALKEHALELYSKSSDFLKLVLNNFPDSKLDEKIGEGETAREILKHAVATPHWWMKRADKPMEFRAQFETVADILNLLDKQNTAWKKMLEDESEVHWTPTTSIPWIIIRSANHMMHHSSMLIFMRHIWSLPSLGPNNPWGNIVDLPGKLLYT